MASDHHFDRDGDSAGARRDLVDAAAGARRVDGLRFNAPQDGTLRRLLTDRAHERRLGAWSLDQLSPRGLQTFAQIFVPSESVSQSASPQTSPLGHIES